MKTKELNPDSAAVLHWRSQCERLDAECNKLTAQRNDLLAALKLAEVFLPIEAESCSAKIKAAIVKAEANNQ